MVLALSGTTPRIRLTNSRMGVDSNSTIRFDLPPEGYAEPDTPVIDVRGRVGGTIFFRDTSGIAFTGAQAMFARHAQQGRKGSYLLIDANSITNVDDVLARAQATLPEGMTLEKKTVNNRTQIWLKVRPRNGIVVIFR